MENPSGKMGFSNSTELFERANQIVVFLITFTKLRNVLVRWPLIVLKYRLSILEEFQKLGYDRPTQEQAQAVRSFVLGSDVFVMPPTGSGKSLCYASLPYIFDSLRRSVGEKDPHHCIAVVVCPLSSC